MTDRRQFVIAGGSIGLAALAAGTGLARGTANAPFFARHDLPLGVQLYALAGDLDTDFDGTLGKLRPLGIRTVETAGFHKRTAAQLRAAFDRAGLRCKSAHIPPVAMGGDLGLDGDLDSLARDMHVIGITQIVLPIAPIPRQPRSFEDFVSLASGLRPDDWRRTAAFLNATAVKLARRDLTMSYHNHNFEFAPHDGETGMDILLRETDPKLVSFELDAGWAAAAGQDPAAILRAHPHRFTQIHVKDIKAGVPANFTLRQDPVEVGSGRMDWRTILPAAYAAGVRNYYIEQEPPYTRPRLDSIAQSAAYLLALKTA